MIELLKLKECEKCEGAGALIQDSGLMKGMIIMCPVCAGSYKKFVNQYGTDPEDGQPSFYVDLSQGVLKKIDKRKDHIIINNKIIKLN